MTGHADPPGLPEVIDEAADTPSWVPWLGFAFVLAAAVYAVLGGSAQHEEAPPAAAAPAAPAHE